MYILLKGYITIEGGGGIGAPCELFYGRQHTLSSFSITQPCNPMFTRLRVLFPFLSLFLFLSFFQLREPLERTNQRSFETLLHPAARSHACQYRVGTLVWSTLILFTRLPSFLSFFFSPLEPTHFPKWILSWLFLSAMDQHRIYDIIVLRWDLK